MNWVTWVFLFAIYAIIVKIIVWVYEKLTKNKDRSKDSFDLKAHNELNDEHFPIVVENDYLLKIEIASKILQLIFYFWMLNLFMNYSIPHALVENDTLDLRMYQMGILTVVIGLFLVLVGNYKMFMGLWKTKLYITIDKSQIIYEYIAKDGEKAISIINNNDITKLSWSFFPYATLSNEIWIKDIQDREKKWWAYVSIPLYLIISLIYQVIYILVNKLKFERYFLYRTDTGILAIPSTKITESRVNFESGSLINQFFINGGYYGN